MSNVCGVQAAELRSKHHHEGTAVTASSASLQAVFNDVESCSVICGGPMQSDIQADTHLAVGEKKGTLC